LKLLSCLSLPSRHVQLMPRILCEAKTRRQDKA
jgi:hypothetical protein